MTFLKRENQMQLKKIILFDLLIMKDFIHTNE